MTGTRALVLGGYGGFGARLARRLASDGWTVLVAGRSVEKAKAFAAGLANAEGLRADRDGDLAPVLAEAKPDLVIDAAGPFQDSGYRVPEACIAARVAYLDLADARAFVCGIGALDRAAKAAGVPVISGASTLPALSSAVVGGLARGMHRVERVEMALSGSGRSTASRSVVEAVLSYAGKLVLLWRGQRIDFTRGASELLRVRHRIAGQRPLPGTVAIAEVPDLDLLPERLPGSPATVFRAGNDSGWQLRALSLLSLPVRWGWLRSLRPWARWLLPIQRQLARLSDGRSAMTVDVIGWRGEQGLVRRWTVMGFGEEGPEIPVLAAQLLARKLRDGALEPGARDAGGLVAHAEFSGLFAPLSVIEATTEDPLVPLYARAMGDRFAQLPAPVRAMHAVIGDGGAVGEGRAERGRGVLAKAICKVMGFPSDGPCPVHVSFAERDGRETWTRFFGYRRFDSEMSFVGDGEVAERFGPLRFVFALPGDSTGLAMRFRRWSAFGIPLPRALAPRISAREYAEGDRFAFDVAVAHAFTGPIIRYTGRIERVD